MILSGEKKEEYREIKTYWIKRIGFGASEQYTHIQFRHGYGNNRPTFTIELKGVCNTLGLPEWGAPVDKTVYVLELGSIIETKNI